MTIIQGCNVATIWAQLLCELYWYVTVLARAALGILPRGITLNFFVKKYRHTKGTYTPIGTEQSLTAVKTKGQ